MNDYSQRYGDTSGRDRQRPAPGDPEAAYYGSGNQGVRWVDADGRPNGRAGSMPYGYSQRTHTMSRRRNGWVKWLLIALAILFAIPLLKVVLALFVVASVILALLFGFVVFLVLLAVTGALLFGAGRGVMGHRRMRL